MTAAHSPLISVDELADLLAEGRRLHLGDVRWRLGGPPGRDSYSGGHLPGAAFIDLERDLAAPPDPHLGRHPLPPSSALEDALRHAGVCSDGLVVVYDDAGATSAARAWWL